MHIAQLIITGEGELVQELRRVDDEVVDELDRQLVRYRLDFGVIYMSLHVSHDVECVQRREA